ncbi:MAG: hypothetical protein GYA21_17565 [Myxococcales bacterium]|nr:hypothetical protein [Myxococcales bacterium]
MRRNRIIALGIGLCGAAAAIGVGAWRLVRLQGELGRLAETVSLEAGTEPCRLRWLAVVLILAGCAGAISGVFGFLRASARWPAWLLLASGLIPSLLSGLAWPGLPMALAGAVLLGERPAAGTPKD